MAGTENWSWTCTVYISFANVLTWRMGSGVTHWLNMLNQHAWPQLHDPTAHFSFPSPFLPSVLPSTISPVSLDLFIPRQEFQIQVNDWQNACTNAICAGICTHSHVTDTFKLQRDTCEGKSCKEVGINPPMLRQTAVWCGKCFLTAVGPISFTLESLTERLMLYM